MAEEKETVEAEVVDKSGAPKKESSFKKFFEKAKKTINGSILEDKIKSAYRTSHQEFDYYSFGDNSLFNCTSVYGELKEDLLTYFGDAEIPPFSVVLDTETEKAYYATSDVNPIVLKVEVDGKTYERAGRVIRLDPNVEEVQVIKAENHYYLYKGSKK